MTNLIHPMWDPVILSWGPLAIRWYGLIYILGFAIVYGLLRSRITHFNQVQLSKQQILDLFFYAAWGVIIGGRLGFCLFL